MNKLNILVILGIFVIISESCEDVFVDDISNKEVVLLSPADSLVTTLTSHTFWWQKVAGATEYNLQIAKPDFYQSQKIILDTTVASDKFDYSLYPGTFQWRVKGINSVSETSYTTRTLTIDSTMDLSGEIVNLISPEANYATQDTTLSFSWQPIYNATEYRLKICIGTWNGVVYNDTIIQSGASAEINLTEETFVWGVQARNDLPSQSNFNYQNLYVDTTAPGKPTLINPEDKEVIQSLTVNFSWNRNSGGGTSIKDSLIVSKDSLFTNDQVVLEVYTSNSEYNWDAQDEENGTYYWHVASHDRAGNSSSFSDRNEFELSK